MCVPCGVEAEGANPAPACRVVQFRAPEVTAGVIKACCNNDLAVSQQGRRVRLVCGVEATGGSPAPARRIVQFSACKTKLVTVIYSSCNEDLAVRQQGRRVLTAPDI